ncbi:hypothetical protein CBS147353_11053 [Aspergillus niger]|nr:hypothetical protein CBS147353_11053 [Aspergillus niger]
MEAPSTSTTDLQDAKTGPCTIDGTTTSTSRTLLVGEVQCNETHANAGNSTYVEIEARLITMVKDMLQCLGEDPTREGLAKTPERYARAILFFTKGCTENPKDIVGNAIFTVDSRELVLVKDIEISSLCEHHLMPFVGKIHIGYIPDGRVLGLSKLARLAEIFAQRLQLQERLTQQIANAIQQILEPQGVGVIMEASHMCMVTRGTQKFAAMTTTCCMTGVLQRDGRARDNFYFLLNRRSSS